ncbi:hypothetical protein A3A20_00095 [Candidatus Wolfebacteria bacterium RIFCSPLOWO2_01_FULL_45_19]|uniref:Phosphatidic acid phosphatase type 2/haloperoxidase domain-containing protein n=1 Tax=Candidatus Wolfebacteria bacterium RIFCSPLOWO2_01_FULL_45_19 TaxID=1802557 RepID=A0A1F8DRA8_9BACT|nr:MAG: Bacitracin transport permease protein BCRC [Parcubacteria group bacterium GW2011_GWB1_45_9]OGM90972.1 MAG: hypothetical protein A3A20_00095 [Candidatus Wolfebacteria bacterium RIFCSPLOWO2_01_FULL_45_19]
MNPDLIIFNLLRSLTEFHFAVNWLIVFLAEYLGYILVAALFYFIFAVKKDWRERWYYFAAGLLSVFLARWIVTDVIRFFYYRPRPFLAFDFAPLIESASASFPSGHAAFFFALVPFAFLLDKKFGYWFTGAVVLMGFARVAAGVHWPSDIIGGAATGLLSFAAVWFILPKFKESVAQEKFV